MSLLNQDLLNTTNSRLNLPLTFVSGRQPIVQIWFTEPTRERSNTFSKFYFL